MDNTSGANDSQNKTLGARVTEDIYEEYEVIQRQRGDRNLSDTVRWALDLGRKQHWQARTGEAA